MSGKEMKLGDLMIADCLISQADCDAALNYSKGKGCLFGEALVDLGVMSRDAVEQYVMSQEGRRSQRNTIKFARAQELAADAKRVLDKQAGGS